jgi:membrane protein DedA with SNARE-associated domain
VHFTGSELSHIIAIYGYWAVFLIVFIESMGIPFPGETTLIVASIYAGSTHQLEISLVIAAAAAGAILGDNTGYAIGRYGGYALLRRYGRYIHVNERELKLGQYLFMRHGGKVVFFGRFVSVLRAWAAFLAGVDRMAWPRFLLFNAAGGILWATIYGVAAYYLGDNIHRIARPVAIAIGLVAAIIVVAFLLYLRRNFTRLTDEAERALPGPLERYQRPRRAKSPDHSNSGADGANNERPARMRAADGAPGEDRTAKGDPKRRE